MMQTDSSYYYNCIENVTSNQLQTWASPNRTTGSAFVQWQEEKIALRFPPQNVIAWKWSPVSSQLLSKIIDITSCFNYYRRSKSNNRAQLQKIHIFLCYAQGLSFCSRHPPKNELRIIGVVRAYMGKHFLNYLLIAFSRK